MFLNCKICHILSVNTYTNKIKGVKVKKIILTGGGTAGHIYPTLAIKKELGKNFEYHYLGGKGMEKDIIAQEKDVVYHEIPTVKLQRKLTFDNFLIPFKLINSINKAKKILKEINPSIIFSKGGFVAVPVVIAAHKLGIPIISHESDLSMGLANKIILKYCNVMCVTFEQTAKMSEKCVWTGQPIRETVLKGNKKNINFENLDKSKPNLLVLGGSLGAKFINEKVWVNIDKLTRQFNVLHVCGKQSKEKIVHAGYKQVEYAENIGDYLAFADVILSRAGSGAINEFLALKKPMFLIPLSKKCSRGDQIENAKLFTNLGYADMIEEENCDDKMFIIKLKNVYNNREKFINKMKNVNIINSNAKIAKIIVENVKK